MANYKRKVIIWTAIAVLAFIGIIALSVLISKLSVIIELNERVTLDAKIRDSYQFIKSYSIGGLAFLCVVFVMGTVISYAGIRTWKYTEMFS